MRQRGISRTAASMAAREFIQHAKKATKPFLVAFDFFPKNCQKMPVSVTDHRCNKVISGCGKAFAQVAVLIECTCAALWPVAPHLLEFFDSYFKISQIEILKGEKTP